MTRKTLGILGGGQLGRMLALAAQPLGVRVTVVDPDENAPAQVAAEHVPLPFDDWDALDELGLSDVVTFEFENVPEESLRRLERLRPVFPRANALRAAQDRYDEKSLFQRLGIPTAKTLIVDSAEDALRAYEALGPFLLKTRRFGYDGKGQIFVTDRARASLAFAELGSVPAVAEEKIPFDRELSVILCRAENGQVTTYPVVENTHRAGILRLSVCPAPRTSEDLEARARDLAVRLAEELDYVGVLALELFERGGELLANEFAPRVHNSGHLTIEGSETSQFENHVRAILGLPLGSTRSVGYAAMVNLIGRVPDPALFLALPDVHLHDYGKEARKDRKVGHVTVRAPTRALLEERLAEVLAIADASERESLDGERRASCSESHLR